MMFSILSGNEKSNTGQSDRSNRIIWFFFASPCRFSGPADTIELILPERFSFVHCEKHSDVFRTRQKKQERELQQLVQNTILAIKCSFHLVSVLESDSALHPMVAHKSRYGTRTENPRVGVDSV